MQEYKELLVALAAQTNSDRVQALRLQVLEAITKLEARNVELETRNRVAICLYCNHEVAYTPGTKGENEAIQNLIEHDKKCPNNPHIKALSECVKYAESRARRLVPEAPQARSFGLLMDDIEKRIEQTESLFRQAIEQRDELEAERVQKELADAANKIEQELDDLRHQPPLPDMYFGETENNG